MTIQNKRGRIVYLNEYVQGFGEVEVPEYHLQDELKIVFGSRCNQRRPIMNKDWELINVREAGSNPQLE